jgi:hypothetical protein
MEEKQITVNGWEDKHIRVYNKKHRLEALIRFKKIWETLEGFITIINNPRLGGVSNNGYI